MHAFTVRLKDGLAPFTVVRVLPILDKHGTVSDRLREQVDRIADAEAARAEMNRLQAADSDAIHDWMLSYELLDAAGARVVGLPVAPAAEVSAI